MTVKELINALKELDPNLKVISPIDDEGNGYRWPDCVDDNAYLHPEDAKSYRPEGLLSLSDLEEEGFLPSDYVQVVYIG